MRSSLAKTVTVLIMLGLLLPGALVMYEVPSASASPAIGRVTVSGTNILVDGGVPAEKFYGVVDTTALQFAIMTYINGETGVRGWTSVFNAPDTPNYVRSPIYPNDTPENFWHQYFALLQYYDCNLVRIGCGDFWGTALQYNAWLNHHDRYIDLLRTMCEQAEAHGVWISLVLAGTQDYPAFTFGGSGSVFDPSSSAFARYASYCRDVMGELENENAIFCYDLFNEPDHNYVNEKYWNGNKVRFNTWAKAATAATDGASTHPRTMGVAALGSLFGWNKADFDLAVGTIGVEILHVHYYGANYDAINFHMPEDWARQRGKPLFWGELAYNKEYPIVRYDFAERTIFNYGGQAITSMVLTGTPNYPYRGGSLVDVHRPAEPADTEPPVFSATSPRYGLMTNGTVTFEWSATDASGISGYRYRLNGGAWSSWSSATSVTMHDLAHGGHVLDVEARDPAGNVGTARIYVQADRTGPMLTILSPHGGERFNTPTVLASWSASDVSGVSHYRYLLDDGEWSPETQVTSVLLTNLSDGEHRIYVEATDIFGHSQAFEHYFIVDTTVPAINILSPSDGTRASSEGVMLEWTSDDIGSLTGLEYRVDDGYWKTGGVSTSKIPFWGLSDGEHKLTVRGTYADGRTYVNSVTVHVDTTAPIVESYAPQDAVQQRPSVITATFSEELASATMMVDGIDGTASLNGSTVEFVPPSPLLRGTNYTVTVSVVDLAGNSMSTSWSFTIADVPPAKGKVTDDGGRPVSGAVVALNTGDQAVTDDDGMFHLDIEPGTYDVTVSKDGYKSVMVSLQLGPEVTATVGLSPAQGGPSITIMLVVGLSMLAIALIAMGMILPGRKG